MKNTYPSPSIDMIRKVRLKYNFSQRDMAELALVTPITWSRWERGLVSMPANVWELVTIKVKTFKPSEVSAPSLEEALNNWDSTNNLTMSGN